MFVKSKLCILSCICFICCCMSFSLNAEASEAYLKAPNPFVYKKPSDIWGKKSYEKMVTNWFVFSDRDNLKLYQSEQELTDVKIVDFLEKFRVLDVKRRHLYVETMDKKTRGWGRVESFIILSHAYKTENAITHKAVLINKIGKIKGEINTVKPLRSPFHNAKPTDQEIRILEFANIYNYYPNEQNARFILLGKGPYFAPNSAPKYNKNIKQIMLGWVPASRVLTWDTREALQPNPQRKYPIYYFKEEEDLKSYYNVHVNDNDFPTCKNVPKCNNSNRTDKELLVIRPDYENQIDRNKWPKTLFRYAILRSNNDINKPFEIGVTSATLDKRVFKKNITEKIEKQRKKLEDRDVVFLIDGTMSMGPYFRLVGEIAKDIMNQFNLKKRKNYEVGELRFGVALYRDYLNKNKRFEINNDLTGNANKIKRNLERIKPLRSGEERKDPAYYPEAVFQGLMRTVEQMNWLKGSRKLIIHIGDVGNHSREQDEITEEIIAKKLADKDISYCAIQLIGQALEDTHRDAQYLFCMQTKTIIKKTAESMLNTVRQNKDMNIFPESDIRQLQSLIQTSNNIGCSQVAGVCSSVGDRRWLLRCIRSNEKGVYKKTISNQVNQLASDIFDAKSILDDIRQGKTVESTITETDITSQSDAVDEIYQSEKNVSSKPFLMPGIVNSLIEEIGQDLYSKRKNSITQAKILEYIGATRMKRINDPQAKKEIIQEIGRKELETYLKGKVNFFTKAYVYVKRPGKQCEKDPDQLIKTILFEKKEFEKLRRPLEEFKEKWHCQIHPENLKKTWQEFMLAILGEHVDSHEGRIDKSQSIKTLYEKQFGLSLRSSHPLLQMEYADIEKGNFKEDLNLEKLAKDLCEFQEELNQIYFNEDLYFSIFGENYIWIDALKLP